MNSFQKDLEIGKHGEALFEKILNRTGWGTIHPTKEQDKSGVDLYSLKDGVEKTWQVKFGKTCQRTGNIAIEEAHTYPDGGTAKGWGQKLNADFVVFVEQYPEHHWFGVLKAEQITHYIGNDIYPLIPTSEFIRQREGKTTWNRLIQKTEIEKVSQTHFSLQHSWDGWSHLPH